MSSKRQFTWERGTKRTVSFANLEAVKKHEPETYALFKQPMQDGDRASNDKYDYRVRHSARFGWGVTRFEKTNTRSYSSVTQVQQHRPQPLQTEGRGSKMQTQRLLDELRTLQNIQHLVDSLIIDVQNYLREEGHLS